MSYLIIAVIVAIVIGPVMWMMPTAKQRKQAELRQSALSQGFTIKVCDLPQSHRQRVRKESAIKGVIYRLPIQTDRPIVMSAVYCFSRVDDELAWQGRPLESAKGLFVTALEQCPDSVVAIEYSAAGIGCYWRERGGMEAVSQIKLALSELGKQLKYSEVEL